MHELTNTLHETTSEDIPALQVNFERQETKYLLTDEQRLRLERIMAKQMIPDEHGPSTIMDLYHDTPDYLLARRCAEKPTYREKVRTRRYGIHDSGAPVFLELKKKCAGVGYKRRAELSEARSYELLSGCGEPSTQIERELDFAIRRYGSLAPAAFIAYDREAFYNPADRDFRMTLDRRVRCRFDDLTLDHGDAGIQILRDGLSLLEIKTSKSLPLWLVRFLSAEKLYKTRFSKYGIAYEMIAQVHRTHVLQDAREAKVIRPVYSAYGNALYASKEMV